MSGRSWRVGCNFTPSSASNQLEFWQAETYDRATIEGELSLAADLGLTSHRVFLHDLLWTHDREGLLARVDDFLGMASARGIGVLLVRVRDIGTVVRRVGHAVAIGVRLSEAGNDVGGKVRSEIHARAGAG